MKTSRLCVLAALALSLGLLSISASADDTRPAQRLPKLYIIGDSTVKNGTKGQMGWGDPFAGHFDPAKVTVVNRARGGRSSRTFLTEGLWDTIVADLKPGDFVLIQFGHNDGGALTGEKGRASLRGTGDETREVTDEKTKKTEVVHTYGWYIRKYTTDAKAKGATPVVLSPVPRNIWKDDKTVARASGDYGKWAAEAAKAEGVLFLDLNDLVAKKYEETGKEKVGSTYFGTDHTHTTEAGAKVTAAVVADGLKGLKESPFTKYMASPAADPKK